MENHPEQSQLLSVSLAERIREILGNRELTAKDSIQFTYSWNGGYEKLDLKNLISGGGVQFSGAYHPHAECDGNPCHYCGHAV